MSKVLIFLTLLFIGWFFGQLNERRHFARLKQEEDKLSHIKVFNIKTIPAELHQNIQPGNIYPGAMLVTGNVVIAVDYFKTIMAIFRRIFGGSIKSYESLMERARREAIIRMKKDAMKINADAIYNARIEFSAIGHQPQRIGGVELLAYGTAIWHTPKV